MWCRQPLHHRRHLPGIKGDSRGRGSSEAASNSFDGTRISHIDYGRVEVTRRITYVRENRLQVFAALSEVVAFRKQALQRKIHVVCQLNKAPATSWFRAW